MNEYIPTTTRMTCFLFSWLLAVGCQSSLELYDGPKDGEDPGEVDENTPDVTDRAGDDDDDNNGGDDDDDDTTPPTDLEPIDLDVVEPWYGTAGHEVTIRGGPFLEDAVILFSGAEATLVDGRVDELTVVVPDLGGDGIAEISVTTSEGASVDPIEFQYFEDGTGQIGALGSVEWYDHRGGYWAAGTVNSGFAQVMLSVPTATPWAQFLYAGTVDSCEREWDSGTIPYIYDPELPFLVISSGATEHLLNSDADQAFNYYEFDLPVAVGGSYDLQPMAGSPSWPEFGVQGLSGAIPTSMAVTSPDFDAATIPLSSQSISLAWSGPYTGDLVLVYAQRLTWNGKTYLPNEWVTCWLLDDGSHTIPSTVWAGWDTVDDYVYISVGRATLPQNVILPHNNARSDVMGVYWSVGFLDAN